MHVRRDLKVRADTKMRFYTQTMAETVKNSLDYAWCHREVHTPTCRWGHAASSVGSSSSGSNSAPVGLDDGGNVLNIFTAN